MRIPGRFARGFDDFRHLTHLAMGLSLGLMASCVDSSLQEAEADQAVTATSAQLVMDPIGDTTMVLTGAVCSGGSKRCFSHVQASVSGHVVSHATPQGFGATDLQSAYKIPTTIPTTPTVAVVDAYGYPELEADLGVYRAQYNLPACTTANGCLKIVNQTGTATPLPAAPPTTDDWTLETALDVDMASAGCPSCKIVVVQATDAQGDGLDIGQAAAASLGATVISNSWGGPEQAGQSLTAEETNFDHPGIAVFVSAGDDGYDDGGQGPDYPATSSHVIA